VPDSAPDSATRQLLDDARSAAQGLATVRDDARMAAIRAIRQLEAALLEALDGQSLRGLKNLGQGNAPIYAARVRGEPHTKLAWPTEPDSVVESLCITPSGSLVMFQCATDEHGAGLDPTSRPAADTDFRAEDIEALTRTLAGILPRHIQAAEQARERYQGIQALSARIERIIEEK